MEDDMSKTIDYPACVPIVVREYAEELFRTMEELGNTDWAETDDAICVLRLVQDVRMCEAYTLLVPELSDMQLSGFVYAAWAARMDSMPFREALELAKKLRQQIYDAAKTLASLLRQIEQTHIDNLPPEFLSIPYLLRKTPGERRDIYMWRAMCRVVLGDPPHEAKSESAEIKQWREYLRYAWTTSPSLAGLLDTVANAAKIFEPEIFGLPAAAIASRKRNPKTEYLRGFAHLLKEVHGIDLTTRVMNAMAITANVAINEPDVDVTYDDVRKAVETFKKKRRQSIDLH
jgi:hypothetical protein